MAEETTTAGGHHGMSPWIGWGISTLLLFLLNRKNRKSSNTSSQQPSKFTDTTVNNIGSPVPVVLGRCLVKNPLISFYGDFRADPYTEEYGMHSKLNVWGFLLPLILQLIFIVCQKDTVVLTAGTGKEVPTAGAVEDVDTSGEIADIVKPPEQVSMTQLKTDAGVPVQAGHYSGTTTAPGPISGQIEYAESGKKRAMIVNVLIQIILWLLLWLFNRHAGRTTIQKGFKYYLGWQHIICWTGDNTGIKKLWMNVYDSNVEDSTEKGVWEPSNHVAWEQDNINGITAHIDQPDMFGGVDEGGGFIGDVRFYFGNRIQPKDPWMIRQMTISEGVPAELKGLTPKYPMYLTCVISNPDCQSGAYIGKQATVPEMWFEVVNYPDRLVEDGKEVIKKKYNATMLADWQKILDFMSGMAADVQTYMKPYLQQVQKDIDDYVGGGDTTLDTIKKDLEITYDMFPPTDKDEFYHAYEPLYNLVSKGVWTLHKIGEDLNPAEAIYEILRNEYWGCNYQEERIDIDSLIELGITCEQEELGVSCLINRVAQANEYITKILDHINGVKYDNPTTGKLSFRLIRNDYDINKLKSFDVSNCESCEFSRLDWSETTSAISMSFTDASNKYDTGQFLQTDVSNRLITGSYTEKQVDGTYFTTTTNARWLAQASLLSAGYPLAAVNLVANRDAYTVTIGEPIKLSWEPYGITQMVFRVTDIDYATLKDGKISITAMEDVFGFDKLDYDFSSTPSWTDPEKEPFDIARWLFMEEPYELSLSLDTYLYAYAAQPSSYSIVMDVWRRVGEAWNRTAQTSSWATVGKFTAAYEEKYEFDPAGFEFSPIGSNGRELLDRKVEMITYDPDIYNRNSGLNLVVADDEIMSYDYMIKVPNGNYILKNVVRGVFDTIPKSHTVESILFFIEYRFNVNGTRPIAKVGVHTEEQLELRTETADKAQAFDPALVKNFYTTRRSEQPSVMANLTFGADRGTETTYNHNIPTTRQMSYDILFKFIGRNKFSGRGILEQTDDVTIIDVGNDTKNVLQISCNGVDFEYKWDARDTTVTPNVNVNNFTLKWVDFCRELDNRVAFSNTVSMSIKTYDSIKDLYSYASYEKIVNYVMPRLAGIVTNSADVQPYADTLVQPTLNSILLPATTVSPQITLTFEDCALIFVGTTPATGTPVIGQDGLGYDLTTEAYRIDGYDSAGKAIIHKINVEEEFIFRTNYTVLMGNWADYFRYRAGKWLGYTPYVV